MPEQVWQNYAKNLRQIANMRRCSALFFMVGIGVRRCNSLDISEEEILLKIGCRKPSCGFRGKITVRVALF